MIARKNKTFSKAFKEYKKDKGQVLQSCIGRKYTYSPAPLQPRARGKGWRMEQWIDRAIG